MCVVNFTRMGKILCHHAICICIAYVFNKCVCLCTCSCINRISIGILGGPRSVGGSSGTATPSQQQQSAPSTASSMQPIPGTSLSELTPSVSA